MQLLRSLIAVDESLGIVIDTLEELGELENTITIYSSDNGYFMGEHTYRDKRLAYENSMRVPMIIMDYHIYRSFSVLLPCYHWLQRTIPSVRTKFTPPSLLL